MKNAGTKNYYADYYQKNKERHDKTMKEWREKENYSTIKSVQKWKDKNPDQVREYHRLRKQEQTKKIRQFINEYKSNCTCRKCNETRIHVLDFHHVDPNEKDFDIGSASKYSTKKLKVELEKCIILCRNCHADFHFLERENNITIEHYLK